MTLPRLLPAKRKAKIERVQRQNRPRSRAHLQWVAKHRRCVAGRDITPVQAAHVRNGTYGGTGLKPGDQWTLSLCHTHHGEQHRLGEGTFMALAGLDMREQAIEFAKRSPVRVIRDAAGRFG